MGRSATAHLAYGYYWNNCDCEDPAERFGHEDGLGGALDEWIASQVTVPNPWDDPTNPYNDPAYNSLPYRDQRARYDAWAKSNDAMISAYYDAKRDIAQRLGVTSMSFGVDGYAGYALVTVHERSYCDAEPVDIDALAREYHDRDAAERLNTVLTALGLERPQPAPGWFMVASFG